MSHNTIYRQSLFLTIVTIPSTGIYHLSQGESLFQNDQFAGFRIISRMQLTEVNQKRT